MEIVRGNAHARGIDPIAITDNEAVLAAAIEEQIGFLPILESVPVHGEANSIRLLVTHHRPGLPRNMLEMTAKEIAESLIEFRSEARYERPQPEDGVRAWKVSRLFFQDNPAVLVSATWLV